MTFVLGMLSGGIAVFAISVYRQRDPVLACAGHVRLDTTSPEDLKLNGAIFIENPGAHNGRVYLRFKNNSAMNDAIGKHATLTGTLRATRIDDGNYISEMSVQQIDYRAENGETDLTDGVP